MLELFASDNYKVIIDSAQHVDRADGGYLEVRGWAADLMRKRALPLSAPALGERAVRRVSREDITSIHGISPNEKLGFALLVPDGCPLVSIELASPGETWTVELDMQRVRRTFTLLRARHMVGRVVHAGTGLFSEAGRNRLKKSVCRRLGLDHREYRQWIKAHETMTRAEAEQIMATFATRPVVSVVTPVYNVEEQWLRACVASMQAQWYPAWELCLADDCSPDAHVREVLAELAAAEPRIKVCYRQENGGIAAATNSAIELATGELVGFMDNDDELAPQALFEVVRAFLADDAVDFVYTDEDKIDERGNRFDPFFKPGFSQQLLWSHNYITHFVVVRHELLNQVGGLRAAYNGSQDYDFILRATRAARRVAHVPQMLYHWRTIETSVAGDPRSKLYAYEAGRKALEENVRAAGFADATVEMLPNLGTYHVTYPASGDPRVLVAVSPALRDAVGDIRAHTAHPAAVEVCESVAEVLDQAARHNAAYIVLLDGIVPVNDTWLDEMLGFMGRPEVGVVGGKVVDRFHQVMNSGLTLRALAAGELFEGAGDWDGDVGYYFRISLPRDLFAVTEDCLMMRAEDFRALDGYDETLPFGLRGIDLCVRLRERLGKTAVWEPFSTFRCTTGTYRTPSRVAIAAYLRAHPDLTDPFAAAWFPPSHARKAEEHVLQYCVDVVRRTGQDVEIRGWAANTHSGNKVDVALIGKSAEGDYDIDRYPRIDVSRQLLIDDEAKLGFTVRVRTTAPVVSIKFSIPEEERIERVNVSPSAMRLHRARHLVQRAAEIRHPRSFMRKARAKFVKPVEQKNAYKHYVEAIEPTLWAQGELAWRPLISVVVPVYNVEERWLDRCVESLRAQTYDAWELCLADDHSSDPAVRPALEKLAASDPRIKVTFREENGHISRATNAALELATGEFIALMDNDDELAPQALFEVAHALNENPELDLIYSDEDKIDEAGVRSDPTFKPDFSPDLLLSTNYISHLGVYRASIMREIGGFRPGYEGSQDYDLVLRFMEMSTPARVRHIPRILYHWRMLATSTAADQGSKSYAFEAGQRALQDALDRRGLNASADTGPLNGIYNVHYRVADAARVSVIIPTRDGYDNIERCVTSLIEQTTYPDFEILIADNGSQNPQMRKLYATLAAQADHPVRVLDIDIPFNYSRINNLAAAEATGRYLVFLNDDTEVIAPDWMTTMVGFAQQERVGVVGAKLYYPNNHVQHAGVVLGLGGVAGHLFVGAARGDVGRYGRLMENANYYAVTAACCMVRDDDFRAVGGFNEDMAVAYNDVDLCIRIHDELGRDNVLAHEAELYHFESVTRGHDVEDEAKRARLEQESARFYERYRAIVDRDPYYNENLSRTSPYLDVRSE